MCGCGWVFLGLGSRRTLVVTRWLRLIVKKMTCVTKKRSVLQQYWNTGTSFAPKIPRQTPSTVFFMLTCKNWAPKIGFEPCKTKKSTCLLLFWITISFGGNAPAVFWSSTRPALHNHSVQSLFDDVITESCIHSFQKGLDQPGRSYRSTK